MSDLERHRMEEPDRQPRSSYFFTALGLGFVVAAILVIITAGTAAAGLPFVIAAAALLGKGLGDLRGHRNAPPDPINKERELLSAIRDNGGAITPAEVALRTSLTVSEADRMLSELAGKGHLLVESEDGSLFYRLPGRRVIEAERRSGG